MRSGRDAADSIQSVSIAEAPYDFADRLQPVPLDGLRRLRIWAPEQHDCATMKIGRGDERDLRTLTEVHRERPLGLPTLVLRYRDTDVSAGPRSRFRNNFLAAVGRLFPEEDLDALEAQLLRTEPPDSRQSPRSTRSRRPPRR